jgi:hypothetical protein
MLCWLFIAFLGINLLFFSIFDWHYKKLKSFYILCFMLPGMLFFCLMTLRNSQKLQDRKLKLINLLPLASIIFYFLYIFVRILLV